MNRSGVCKSKRKKERKKEKIKDIGMIKIENKINEINELIMCVF